MRLLLSLLLLSSVAFAADDKPVVVSLSGLKAEAPKDWKKEKPANLLRSYQFKLATPDKDHADAEVIVMPESSSDVTKSFDKWKAQYTPPDDKKAADVTKTDKFEQAGATMLTLDIYGTWTYRERPNDPKTEKILPEFRTIWVMVVTKDETTHIRFSGHKSVVEKHEKDFFKWVKSLK
jgi:hypothetical protein